MVETIVSFLEQERQQASPQDKQEKLKILSYRLNLANWYLLNNLCTVTHIKPVLETKYSRHDAKSYMDMKKKNIRIEARQERLANQRAIIKELSSCDAEIIDFAYEEITRNLRADGYKLKM